VLTFDHPVAIRMQYLFR